MRRYVQPFVCKRCSVGSRVWIYLQTVLFGVLGVFIVFFVVKRNLEGRSDSPSTADFFKVGWWAMTLAMVQHNINSL